MQKKNLLSKIIIPLALTLFSSGCYSVVNVGRENYESKKEIIELDWGIGSYYGGQFYKAPGYIGFFNLDAYGNFNSRFHHQKIYYKPFWDNKPRIRFDFQRSRIEGQNRPALRNPNDLRNNRRNR